MENSILLELLNQNNYNAILSLETLSMEDIELILNFDLQYNNNFVAKVVELLRKKVLTAIKTNRFAIKIKNVKDFKKISTQATASISNSFDYVRNDELIGLCYKKLAECYLFLNDTINAKQFYFLADQSGVDCKEQLRLLSENYQTDSLNKTINLVKSLHSEKEVAEYSYRLIEEKLQLLEQPLDEYEVTLKLKSCLSTYLRNQFTDLQETTPTSELVTAIEAILKGMFYLPFAREIDEKRTEYASVRTRLARSFRVNENSNFEMYNFTMGNFPYLIKDNNNISQEFYDFICEYYNIDKVKFPPQVFVEMAEYFQFFAQWIRNPVCHGMVMQKLAFEHLCEETVLKDDSWISKIVKITDMEYPAEEKSGHKWFNKFYQKLIEYKEKYGGFDGVSRDYDIGKYVLGVRQAYKGKNNHKLTQEMIDKLNAIEFPWQVEKVDWFTPFYQKLIEYKEKYGGFAGVTRDKEIGRTVFAVRQAYKGKGAPKLTQEMREQLNLIEFPFELKKSLIHERVVENSKKKKNTFEDEDTFTL